MDEVLAKLVRVSAEGLTYVGHISVANRIGARGTFKPKASARMLCIDIMSCSF
jgi:hypothetical protein